METQHAAGTTELDAQQPIQSGGAHDLLSPKELAEAIGVSESSMKRWTDEGRVVACRTAGGHRRIAIQEAVRFVRANRHTIVRPDLLGLPELAKASAIALPNEGADPFHRALMSDDAAAARGVLLAQYLAGMTLASICDGHVRNALTQIGELWKHSERGILIEHRAVDTCVQAFHHLRRLVAPPADDAPIAMGCAPQGDPYLLPTLMAAAVLAECGWRDYNLGPESPLPVVLAGIERYQPSLVWYALSTSDAPPRLADDLSTIADALAKRGAHLVVGGRGAHSSVVPVRENVIGASTMVELYAFVKGLNAARPKPASH